MLLQIESAKAGSERTTGSREEQDELELPNFRKHARGGGMPLLGQVRPVSSVVIAVPKLRGGHLRKYPGVRYRLRRE